MKPLRDAGAAVLLLLAMIAVGSGGLAWIDHALLGYLAATLIAAAALTWRVSAFWRRPASAFYARALWAGLLQKRHMARTLSDGGKDLLAQDFIRRRSVVRWLAHLALSFGTLGSFAITVPLVFGWLRFSAVGEQHYQIVLFTQPALRFDVEGPIGWLLFHGLTLCGVAVALGSAYFIAARLRVRRLPQVAGAFALGPLILLLVVALTGLALPASRDWPEAFRVASMAHELSVVLLLVALPFSKLSHLLVRPLQLGARAVRRDVANWQACADCNRALAPAAQQQVVANLLARRGLFLSAGVARCPSCRRRQLAAQQAAVIDGHFQPALQARSRRGRHG